ncbi:MAG: hypothetical protein ACI959_001392 [Limisphaerales bacterium]|jgi:hypothetical protein
MQKLYPLKKLVPIELLFWIGALVALYWMPLNSPANFEGTSLCILTNLGFNWCPGCGIGHSITHVMHGNLQASIAAHPVGIFALLVIVFRIFSLFGVKTSMTGYTTFKLPTALFK